MKIKELHFTGTSHWEKGNLITEITADDGYLLLYGTNERKFKTIRMSCKNYDEQLYHINKLTAVFDTKG